MTETNYIGDSLPKEVPITLIFSMSVVPNTSEFAVEIGPKITKNSKGEHCYTISLKNKNNLAKAEVPIHITKYYTLEALERGIAIAVATIRESVLNKIEEANKGKVGVLESSTSTDIKAILVATEEGIK